MFLYFKADEIKKKKKKITVLGSYSTVHLDPISIYASLHSLPPSPSVSGSSRSLLDESSSVCRFFSRPSSSGRLSSWLKDTSSSWSACRRPSCEGRVCSLFPSTLRRRRATRPHTSPGRPIRRLWQSRSSER